MRPAYSVWPAGIAPRMASQDARYEKAAASREIEILIPSQLSNCSHVAGDMKCMYEVQAPRHQERNWLTRV